MIPLEDNVGDIISKGQRGLGLNNETLATQAEITPAQLRAVKGGEVNLPALRRIARVLHLDADSLADIARDTWYPQQPPVLEGFRMFNTRYGDMSVNAYLVWDAESRKAVVFDTGADAAVILSAARELKLTIELILLTHAHTDHVAELPKLVAATKAPAWINGREADDEDFPDGVQTFAAGQSFVLGTLRIETRLTSGHAPGQTTYIVKGLSRPLAIVGDSLFAGSAGGGVALADQLRNNREHILTLPDETILACGHGPLTTVGQEKEHNPFFAGLKS